MLRERNELCTVRVHDWHCWVRSPSCIYTRRVCMRSTVSQPDEALVLETPSPWSLLLTVSMSEGYSREDLELVHITTGGETVDCFRDVAHEPHLMMSQQGRLELYSEQETRCTGMFTVCVQEERYNVINATSPCLWTRCQAAVHTQKGFETDTHLMTEARTRLPIQERSIRTRERKQSKQHRRCCSSQHCHSTSCTSVNCGR